MSQPAVDPKEANSIYYQLPESALITLSSGTGIPLDELKEMTSDKTLNRILQNLNLEVEKNLHLFEEALQRLNHPSLNRTIE